MTAVSLPEVQTDFTDLAREVATASLDGKIDIRISTVDTPVQVSYLSPDGSPRLAYGATVADALHASALRQESERAPAGARDMDPLPGHPLGPHDSIVLRGRDTEPLSARIVWMHRASHNGNGRVRGQRCEEEGINAHAILVDDLEGLSLTPAVTCSVCGRSGWITEGRFIPAAAQQTTDRLHDEDLS